MQSSSQSQYKSKVDVKMVVFSENDQLRSSIQVPQALIETIFKLAISKIPKKDINKKLINKTDISN